MKKVKLSPLLQITNATSSGSWELPQIEALFEQLTHICDVMGLKFSLYFPGDFLEFLAQKSPGHISWLRAALKEEKIEVLGGAYHDALLPLWPREIQSAQLQRHQALLRKYLGFSPRGWYCPSFAWEISMVKPLTQQGYEYTVLPDTAFADSLALPLPIAGWRTIENNGEVIRAFPCNSALSDFWSRGATSEFIEELKSLSHSDRALLVRIPLSIGTEQNWQRQLSFISEILPELTTGELEVQWWLPARAIDQIPPKGPLSLISALGEDSGLPKTVNTCRELLNRRPESNLIHKRVLHTFRRAQQVLEFQPAQTVQNLLQPVQAAQFYRNVADHRGINRLKNRILAHNMLIKAEKKLDQLSERTLRLDVADFLGNGSRQIIAATPKIGFVLDHIQGGVLRTFDHRKLNINWIVAQRENGEPAAALQDYLLPANHKKPVEIAAAIEEGQGVLNARYDYQIKRQSDRLQVLMSGDQAAEIQGKHQILRMTKVIGFKTGDDDLQISWQITNGTFNICKGYFATEVLGAFDDENRRQQYFVINGKKMPWSAVLKGVEQAQSIEFVHHNQKVNLVLETHKPCIFIVTPVMGSGAGAAPQQFQGYRMVFAWEINLKGQESAALHLRMALGRKGLWS